MICIEPVDYYTNNVDMGWYLRRDKVDLTRLKKIWWPSLLDCYTFETDKFIEERNRKFFTGCPNGAMIDNHKAFRMRKKHSFKFKSGFLMVHCINASDELYLRFWKKKTLWQRKLYDDRIKVKDNDLFIISRNNKFFLENESRSQQPLIFTHEYNHLQNEGMVDRRT